jgi:hypothetical protein
MTEVQVPGIYISEQNYRLNALYIDGRCLTGFAGIAERGPLHTPVHITGFDEYLKIFGSFDTAGHLPFSVYSYFKCGGSECVVVRTANEKYARKARLAVKCSVGRVIFEASSEGKWGNQICARIWHEGEALDKIAAVDSVEGAWISIDDDGLEANDILRITFEGRRIYRIIERKEGNKLYLSDPPKMFCKVKNPAADLKVEKAFVSVSLSCNNKTENFLHLSMNPLAERYYLSYINERSRLCAVMAGNAKGIMRDVFSLRASGGMDGIAEMSAGDFIGCYEGPNRHRGIGAFESRDDISLVCAPDASWLLSQPGKTPDEREQEVYAVQTAMINQAERFPGRFAVLDMPGHLDGLKALSWAKRLDSNSAAAYYPYIDMIDPTDRSGAKTVRVPPSGAVCGCIAAVDGKKGIFHAPANMPLQGAVGLAKRIEDAEIELLYPAGINLLKYFPGRGIKIWGARTLSSNPDWRYINVRRTFSAICKSLKRGTQWAVFEPNDKNLRKRLVRQVSGFLLDLWMKGYLSGSTAEQGFYVRCDEELNPPENIDNGVITFEAGLAITKPTEFFKISITAEKEGASVYIQED